MPSTYEESAPGDETGGEARAVTVGDLLNDVPDAGLESETAGWASDDYDGVEPHHNLD
ncbi:hypothetical protein [Saccharothrix sp. ST-888]|uniref:hypothetical protein n=1 Tax=Saccharothrix sp. ST-888 TaxID=1427391 RepID=UPI000B083EDF|nr:hypothetical protein [Saccharothrix sp. ST-888]